MRVVGVVVVVPSHVQGGSEPLHVEVREHPRARHPCEVFEPVQVQQQSRALPAVVQRSEPPLAQRPRQERVRLGVARALEQEHARHEVHALRVACEAGGGGEDALLG